MERSFTRPSPVRALHRIVRSGSPNNPRLPRRRQRSLPHLVALCLLLIGMAGILPLLGPTLEAAATGAPGQELMQVPLRWCAVRGSDAQANPGSVGEPSTNDYLWRRHERASDRLLIPGAMITGRSAFTAAYLGGDPTRGSFPIIEDPVSPANGGPGALGDILDPQIDPAEFNLAWQACNVAWDALRVPGEPLVGIPTVNLHRFVNADGSPSTLAGFGAYTFSTSGGGAADLCTIPPTITAATFVWTGRFAVSDYSLTRGFDPDDRLVAHEFGHAVSLNHGNGLDDNNNQRFDQNCDNAENVQATPHSFMTSGASLTNVVTGLQREKMRAVIRRLPGTQIDPPAALVNADTVSDQRTDAVLDVFDPGVDLATVAVAEIPSTDTFVISHLTFGLIPREDMNNQYLAFADLDNDPLTGGAPADLGFNTTFQGAELVTQVRVEPGHEAFPTAWVYQNGSFEAINADLYAEVSTLVGSENEAELANTVSIGLPLSLRGPATIPFRLQAIAEQLQGDLELDILPNGSLDGGHTIALVPPIYPVCSVEPLQAQPGDTVNVEITGLLPNENAHVVLGDVLVATGSIDGNGDATIELTLPGDTRAGPRLVTVGVDGTALTADCYVDIPGDRGSWEREATDAHAAVGTWRITATDDQSDQDQTVTYLTIHADGTVLAANPEAGIGLGAWSAAGPRSANLTIEFAGTAASGELVPDGTLAAQGTISVDETGSATLAPFSFVARSGEGDVLDEWDGAATAQRLSPPDDIAPGASESP